MLLYQRGSPGDSLDRENLRAGLTEALTRLGPRRRVLAVPPDITRYHSRAGVLTELAWEHFGAALTDVLPATGTHFPMTADEIARMFGRTPGALFRTHQWRDGLPLLGEVPAGLVREVSDGAVDYGIPIRLDPLVVSGHDLILSIGQVVPHEVIGMAGHAKNVFIGAGGAEGIHKTHFLGAVFGMERIMGRANTPVRAVLDYASRKFAQDLPIVHVLTVVGIDSVVRGLFIGDDRECFELAAKLSLEVNVTLLDRPLARAVVYLDPHEYKSTWLGNKSIYRTRMAIADGGELIVLAPGVAQFGEDREIDRLIRRYGYAGTPRILDLVKSNADLERSLGAAAHLIHGSTEGRFTVTYAPGGLSREEVEGAGYRYAPLQEMLKRYDPARLKEGVTEAAGGEEVFFIANPGLGLWAHRSRFDD